MQFVARIGGVLAQGKRLGQRDRLLPFIRTIVVSTVCFWMMTATLQAAAPTVTHVFPAGGQRGTTVETNCVGKFDWPLKVSAPGLNVVVGEEKGKLTIDIPPDLATDRVWIRVYNPEGTSARIPFLIGSLPEFKDHEPNNSVSTAQALDGSRLLVNGVLKERADVDVFAVEMKAGQTLVASLDAHDRLGSPMDAVLQISSADGTVLGDNHDDVRLDPRLAHTATESGTYLVRLFSFSSTPNTSIAYQNGDTFIYRLTMTTGPFATHSIPLSAPFSDPGEVRVMGWNIDQETKVNVRPLIIDGEYKAEEKIRRPYEVRIGLAIDEELANPVRLSLVNDESRVVTTNDEENPFLFNVPCTLTGQLLKPRQQDVFEFPLKKDQRVLVSLESHSVGSHLLPTLKLSDPMGAVAAEVDRSGPPQDAFLAHTAKHDGNYRIRLSDRYRQGGERFFYRLAVRLEEADYRISSTVDSLVITHDKPTELPISIQRFVGPEGAVGEIQLDVLDLPDGVTAPTVTSKPEGDTSGKVTLSFASTGTAFSGPIRIRAISDSPKKLERYARTPELFGSQTESIWLTVIAKP